VVGICCEDVPKAKELIKKVTFTFSFFLGCCIYLVNMNDYGAH
jgi:hypothetical protein